MLCPCCGGDLVVGTRECSCGARFVGEPCEPPEIELQRFGPAILSVILFFLTVSLSFISLWAACGAVLVAISARRAIRLIRANPERYGGYRVAASVLAVTLVSGSVIGGYGFSRIPRLLDKRRIRATAATAATFYEITNLVESYRRKNGSYPPSGEVLRRFAGRPLPKDYWDRLISYQTTANIADARKGGGPFQFNNFELRSPGPDGELETQDDLVMRDGVLYSNAEAMASAAGRIAGSR
jgi:hypothetical protein